MARKNRPEEGYSPETVLTLHENDLLTEVPAHPAGGDPTPEAPPALPPLEEPCPGCGGQGTVKNHAWDEWRAKRARGEEARPPYQPERTPCRSCHGQGGVPTEAGRAVIAFVRRHWHTAV